MGKTIRGLFFGLIAILLILTFSNFKAQAVTTASNPGSLKKVVKDVRQDAKKLATTAATKKATRASEFALTACEIHVRVIKQKQTNIINHSSRIANRLEKITTAVENYYNTKLVPAGKTVPNYDSLVSDVSSKQAALVPLIEKIETDSEGLTCDKSQAKTQFANFRKDMQLLIKGIKDYRLSVINLLKAVKGAKGVGEESASSSAATKEED